MWRVLKEAGRPIPRFSEDDVLDYMITEAILIKVQREDEAARTKKVTKDWREDRDHLKQFQ
jgi:phage/plasmid-associated DNA primase